MKRLKNIKKVTLFTPAKVFLLILTIMSGVTSNAWAATGSFDRNNYLPSLSDANDYDRVWLSVTDTTANVTSSQDTLQVSVKAGINTISFALKETGGTTAVFTTTGLPQPVMYPVGTNSGYVEDFTIGNHNYPALGTSVVGLNLKSFAANTGGDAITGADGVLTVAAGDTLELLSSGTTLDTASIGFNSGSIGFSPPVITSSLSATNIIIMLADPDENLNPAARDVIGFADGSALLAGSPGTGSSRVQIDAKDWTTGTTLLNGSTSILTRHIMLVETGVNAGTFVATGKVYGTTTTVSPSDLKGNVLVGSSSATAYGGESITLGDLVNGPSVTFRIIEANASIMLLRMLLAILVISIACWFSVSTSSSKSSSSA